RIWRLVAQYEPLLRKTENLTSVDRAGKWDGLDAISKKMRRHTHLAIQRVTTDIGTRYNFNTAISTIMEWVNALYIYKEQPTADPAVGREALERILILLAPFAPHITEELWREIGHTESIHVQPWPEVDETALEQDEVTIILQVNGKVRDRIQVSTEIPAEELEASVLSLPKVSEWTQGKKIMKIITVPGKLINVVVK
ncbi:MAG: class I tRNA ligase family protein, partial [Bacillota bacterium]|nr:class I tRNA ligase family protein [Bacillota bacterium]